MSHLAKDSHPQLTLPLSRNDNKFHHGSERAAVRCAADGAVDSIRERFGWKVIGYGSVLLDLARTVPDEFRELAEQEL